MDRLVSRSPTGIAMPKSGSSDRTEFLGFRLDDSLYAAPISLVREILRVPTITPIPRSPKHIMGITSVRGALITVIDLRVRLNLPTAEPSRRSRVLLVEARREQLGLFVDEVNQVYRLAQDEIEVAATALGGDVAEYIVGIARPMPSSSVWRDEIDKRQAHDAESTDGDGATDEDDERDVVILLDLLSLLS